MMINQKNNKIIATILGLIAALFIGGTSLDASGPLGFTNMRSFSTLESTTSNELSYTFGVVDIPTTRIGTASSSTGFEFGKLHPTSATAFSIASSSADFAITMRGSGRIKACTFDLNAASTTGTVSIMIQLNGVLQSGKYCKLPSSGTFATNGGFNEISRTEAIGASDIPFVAGDRIGIVASSSNLSAGTIDGIAKLIIQLNN